MAHILKLYAKMGFEKEIILVKNANSRKFSALDFLNILKPTDWKETLFVIDRGNDFDWINAKDKLSFEEILVDKMANKEYIGFTIQNQKNKRFVTINIDKDRLIFTLEIDRNENEASWFSWYHEEIVKKLKEIVEVVEWRSNYDNEIIKLFKQEDL